MECTLHHHDITNRSCHPDFCQTGIPCGRAWAPYKGSPQLIERKYPGRQKKYWNVLRMPLNSSDGLEYKMHISLHNWSGMYVDTAYHALAQHFLRALDSSYSFLFSTQMRTHSSFIHGKTRSYARVRTWGHCPQTPSYFWKNF